MPRSNDKEKTSWNPILVAEEDEQRDEEQGQDEEQDDFVEDVEDEKVKGEMREMVVGDGDKL